MVASLCAACGAQSPAQTPELTGTARADIDAPPGVECVRVEIDGRARNVVSDVPVTPGSGNSVEIGLLPLGSVVAKAAGFNVACGSVTASTIPEWVTPKPVAAQIPPPPAVANISLTLVQNGDAVVQVGFEDDCAGIDPAVAAGLLTRPTLTAIETFGDADVQYAAAITQSCPSGDLLVAGTDGSSTASREGLVLRYPSGSNSPSNVAHGEPGTTFLAMASAGTAGEVVFGGALPPTCGAHDGVGDTEQKSLFASIASDGTGQSCVAGTTFFPYSGYEFFEAGLRLGDGNFFGAGVAETCGFGNQVPVLAKFDGSGTLLAQATEPGEDFANPACAGASEVKAATEDLSTSSIFLSGYSALTGFGEDSVHRPVLLRYGADLSRTWKSRDAARDGEFDAVSIQGSNLYAAGTSAEGGFVEKYDLDGNEIWSVDIPQASSLSGIIALPARLYAVGDLGSGSTEQAVLLELDPAGVVLSTLPLGGQPSAATGIALDGQDLVVVGSAGDSSTSDLLFARFALQAPDAG